MSYLIFIGDNLRTSSQSFDCFHGGQQPDIGYHEIASDNEFGRATNTTKFYTSHLRLFSTDFQSE